MARKLLPLIRDAKELDPGNGACPGCGSTLVLSHLVHIILSAGRIPFFVIPASCWTINIGRFPQSIGHNKISFDATLFASAPAEAAAYADVFGRIKKREDVIVVAFCGDGSTYDIAFGGVSSAAERNDNFLYILNDNEAYMNTGIQKSGATPFGAVTTTTPASSPKQGEKKDIDFILAEHKIPYLATATLGSVPMLKDFYAKVEKAVFKKGFRFIHTLNPCPPGWKSKSEDTVRISELAVMSNIFPLVEFENGAWRITHMPLKTVPVTEYLTLQERFARLTEKDVAFIQSSTDERFERFKQLSKK